MLGRPPAPGTPVPATVTELADGRSIVPVWRNERGGLTYEIGTGEARRFVKWAPTDSGLDLVGEAERMTWLRAFSAAPVVEDVGTDEGGEWLVTEPLPGESAVSERWQGDPAAAVAAIGAGLRHLHDHAPVAACPFSWTAEERISRARAARIGPTARHPEHWYLSAEEALAVLDEPPLVDTLVVCHGDACAPNTIVDDGRWTGHVDLGRLGVADRWADLAIATWSTEWNYGASWERQLLDAYGIDPDPERTAYYRLLWDLSP